MIDSRIETDAEAADGKTKEQSASTKKGVEPIQNTDGHFDPMNPEDLARFLEDAIQVPPLHYLRDHIFSPHLNNRKSIENNANFYIIL